MILESHIGYHIILDKTLRGKELREATEPLVDFDENIRMNRFRGYYIIYVENTNNEDQIVLDIFVSRVLSC